MSKQDLLAYIELRREQIEDLEKRYGTGVRPASVGEEIMILTLHLENAQKQFAAMEAQDATD
jgi:hypothetical protein